ncbi:MAG: hypothetical protein ABJ381_16385, partial [Ilumatobacter sp.]
SITSEPERPARRKPRALAVLGASMLVAGAGGIGFGLGHSADDAVAPSAAPVTDTAATADTPDERAPETLPPIEPNTTGVAEGVPGVVTVVTSEEMAGGMDGEVAGDAVVTESSGGGGWTMFGGEPMTLLTERTTDSGVVLRAHLGQVWEQDFSGYDDFGGPEGWRPPDWCFESAQVRIAMGGGEATGTSVIDVGSVSWWTTPFGGRSVSALTMGTADANPHRVVFVQAPASVGNVTVTFGDGASDSTAPVDGVAILAVPGAGPSTDTGDGWVGPPTDFDVVFDDSAAEDVVVDGSRTGYNDPEYQQSCSPPPPALPEPGEQPADPAADEATIVDLMVTIYGDDDGGNEARIDDPTGVAEAREQVREGGFEEAAANAEAIVEELVFTSPTDAWFRYRIETTTGIFPERFGIAVNVDGTWKITRATICQDLSLAGGNCGNDTGQIRPPGS